MYIYIYTVYLSIYLSIDLSIYLFLCLREYKGIYIYIHEKNGYITRAIVGIYWDIQDVMCGST